MAIAEPIDAKKTLPISLKMKRLNETTVRFTHSFRPEETQGVTAFDVMVVDEHQRPIADPILVTINDRGRKQSVNLTLRRSVEAALENEPEALMLYGYVCRLLPKSPDPDESLTWDD